MHYIHTLHGVHSPAAMRPLRAAHLLWRFICSTLPTPLYVMLYPPEQKSNRYTQCHDKHADDC